MTIVREFVSTVFIVHKGKVLLNLNKNCNIWVPVGGHIEQNELPCDSVIREAKEETGLDIELICPFDQSKKGNLTQPVNVHLDHVKEDHKHINLIYFAVLKGGEFSDTSDDGQPSKWFSKEEIEKADLLPNIKEWALEALKQIGSNQNS